MVKPLVRRLAHRAVLTCLVVLTVTAISVPGRAQQAQLQQAEGGQAAAADGTQATTVTVGELEALVSTLENADERAVFLDNLKALIQAQNGLQGDGTAANQKTSSLDVMGRINAGIGGLDSSLGSLLDDFRDGGGMAEWFDQHVADPQRADDWLDGLWQLAVIAAAGVAAAWALGRVLRGQVARMEVDAPAPWVNRLGMTVLRCVMLLVPVAGMAGGAYAAMAVLPLGGVVAAIATPLVLAAVAAQSLLVVARCFYAPMLDQMRLLPLTGHQAAYLYVWTARFIVVAVYGAGLTEVAQGLGVPDSAHGLATRMVGLALVLMVFVFVLQVRRSVGIWIREHPEQGGAQMLRNRIADIWHILAMLMVVAIYVVWALEVEGGFSFLVRGSVISVVTLFVALVASTGMRSGLDRLFSIRLDLRTRFPGLDRRANRYVSVLHWLLNVVLWFFAVMVILEAWEIDAMSILATPEGAAAIGHIVTILITVLVAVVVWEMGDGIVTRHVAPTDGGTTSARLKTLLPLMRNVILATICTIAAITILSELGVDIGPLLAGAGVIGLAVGFGAQALVRDVITGAFILFEDQVQIGDYVEAGGKSGTVESLSVRTLRMRDLDGYVHIVPFGEVAAVTNMTRDFGYALIDVGVAYQENTDHVLDVIREVDKEARQDEALAERLVGDLEVMGVHALDASAVTLRVRIKTLAGYQWGVRREYFRRIKLKFDQVGIEIPFPHMTVYFGEIRGGNTPPAHLRIDAGDIEVGETRADVFQEAPSG
jgi:moderate conductance mechanosensitive channel